MKRVIFYTLLALVITFSAGCMHKHEWIEATCSEAKHCSHCSVIDGEPLAHKWNEATCENAKICSGCGITEGMPIGHKVEVYETTLEPTCTSNGKQEGFCSLCEKIISEEVDKIEHIDDNKFVMTRDLSDAFLVEQETHCTVCGEVVRTISLEISLEQHNAIKQAKRFLSNRAYSNIGLMNKLQSVGFSFDAAFFATHNIIVDWNEQAAKRAESYITSMSFSRSRLIGQLKYEGFSDEEAEYGVSAVGY